MPAITAYDGTSGDLVKWVDRYEGFAKERGWTARIMVAQLRNYVTQSARRSQRQYIIARTNAWLAPGSERQKESNMKALLAILK